MLYDANTKNMRRNSTGPTLKEVALAAGVSIPAASKVLHGRGSSIRVSEVKAAEIREAAKRLKYTPNALARSLRSSRSNTIGLVFEHFGHIAAGPQYYVQLLDGIASELFKFHYRLTILPEVPHHQVASVLNNGTLDGIIWCKLPADPQLLKELEDCPLPIIALNTPPASETDLCFFSCDNEDGMKLAVDHLAALGHRRILFAMELGETETPDAQARLSGMRQAMEMRQLEFGDEDIVCWSFSVDEFPAWFASKPPHTAVIAWNEGIAGSIISAARSSGITIPKQLSVIGFDSTPYCDSMMPRLTAVRQPISEMAHAATRHLLNILSEAESVGNSVKFTCSLDVRDSTSPPFSA